MKKIQEINANENQGRRARPSKQFKGNLLPRDAEKTLLEQRIIESGLEERVANINGQGISQRVVFDQRKENLVWRAHPHGVH